HGHRQETDDEPAEVRDPQRGVRVVSKGGGFHGRQKIIGDAFCQRRLILRGGLGDALRCTPPSDFPATRSSRSSGGPIRAFTCRHSRAHPRPAPHITPGMTRSLSLCTLASLAACATQLPPPPRVP